MIEPGSISTNIVNNIKTAKGFDPSVSPYAKMVQLVFQAFESIGGAYLSHPSKVAQTILKIIKSPNPELRNPVGKDAEAIFKVRAELSDKEVEHWARESYMEKKGFIRQ